MAEDISKYIDLDTALTRVNGKKAMYRKLLGLFLKSPEFTALEEALAAADYAKAAEVAHGIKGMTGNLALTEVFNTSTELMLELKKGVCDAVLVENYRAALEGTRASVTSLIAELEKEG
jgi:HPt (histidine-containing phosphotransfer) domain-containing protein